MLVSKYDGLVLYRRKEEILDDVGKAVNGGWLFIHKKDFDKMNSLMMA